MIVIWDKNREMLSSEYVIKYKHDKFPSTFKKREPD